VDMAYTEPTRCPAAPRSVVLKRTAMGPTMPSTAKHGAKMVAAKSAPARGPKPSAERSMKGPKNGAKPSSTPDAKTTAPRSRGSGLLAPDDLPVREPCYCYHAVTTPERSPRQKRVVECLHSSRITGAKSRGNTRRGWFIELGPVSVSKSAIPFVVDAKAVEPATPRGSFDGIS
jgi:hypothetical protein